MLKQFRTRSEDDVDPRIWGKSGEKRCGRRRDTKKNVKETGKGRWTTNTRVHSACSFGSFFLVLFALRREQKLSHCENGEMCKKSQAGMFCVDIVSIVRPILNKKIRDRFGEESVQLKIRACLILHYSQYYTKLIAN